MTKYNHLKGCFFGFIFAVTLVTPNISHALTLKEAVGVAIETNPEIGQAIENREAREFELKQAVGLYMPRVDIEASTGVQRFDSPARRAAGIEDDPLYPSQVELAVSLDLLDGGFRRSEANRQAARIDSASFLVLERSELIGLEVARLYFEILLQGRIIELSRKNVSFHRTTLGNVNESIRSGKLTDADRQQATERLAAANASVVQALEALEVAKIGFRKAVGVAFRNPSSPQRVGNYLPPSLERAIEVGRQNNPRVLSAESDVDAALALVNQAKGALGPTLTLEGRATTGSDISGVADRTTDLEGRLVLSWSIFDGRIRSSKVQENIRLEGEALFAQQKAARDVEEAVRTSWNRIARQGDLANEYGRQLVASNGVVSSYTEQFKFGSGQQQRTLLDVLDAQNTRFNVQVLSETAKYSERFAEYRLMAATGTLLAYLDLEAPETADAYARDMLDTPSASTAEPHIRVPVDFTSPIDLTKFVN